MSSAGPFDPGRLRELISRIADPHILVRTSPGFLSHFDEDISQIFNRLTLAEYTFSFVDHSVMLFAGPQDYENRLLDLLVSHSGSHSTKVYENELPSWFIDWALALARLYRADLAKRYSIGLESAGLIVCSHVSDSPKLVASLLASQNEAPRALLVLGSVEKTAELINELQNTYQLLIGFYACEDLNSLEERNSLGSFLNAFRRRCHQQLYERPPSDFAQLRGGDDTIVAMTHELQAGKLDTAQRILRKTAVNNKVLALAYIYRALYNIRLELDAKPEEAAAAAASASCDIEIDPLDLLAFPMPPLSLTSITDSRESALADLDVAACLYLKTQDKWPCIMAATIGVVYGGPQQVEKLGSMSAALETNTDSDYARAALTLELCSAFTPKEKRRMFHLVMAGHLYAQAGIHSMAQRCYRITVSHYSNKKWNIATQHLYGILSRSDASSSIDALNLMALDNLAAATPTNNGNADSKYNTRINQEVAQKEMGHLRRLLGVDFNLYSDTLANGCNETTLSHCNFGQPRIVLGDFKPPPMQPNDTMPLFLRVPIIRNANTCGYDGKDTSVCTVGITHLDQSQMFYITDDGTLQEHLLYQQLVSNATKCPSWNTCLEFTRTYMHDGNKCADGVNLCTVGILPCQVFKLEQRVHLNSTIVIKLVLENPLHIQVSLTKLQLLLDRHGNDTNADTTTTQPTQHRLWVSAKSNSANVLELKPRQRANVELSFVATQTGSFKIVGLGWYLGNGYDKGDAGRSNSIACWAPLYTIGPRVHMGTLPCEYATLKDYVEMHEHDRRLCFKVSDCKPKIACKMSSLVLLPQDAIFKMNDQFKLNLAALEYCINDETDAAQVADEHLTDLILDATRANPDIQMHHVVSGQHLVWRLEICNKGNTPITRIALTLKSFGRFSCPAVVLEHENVPQDANVYSSDVDMNKENMYKGLVSFFKLEHNHLIPPNSKVALYGFLIPLAGASNVTEVDDGTVAVSTSAGFNVACMHVKLLVGNAQGETTSASTMRYYFIEPGLEASAQTSLDYKDMVCCSLINKSQQRMQVEFTSPAKLLLVKSQAIHLEPNCGALKVLLKQVQGKCTILWNCPGPNGSSTRARGMYTVNIQNQVDTILDVTVEKVLVERVDAMAKAKIVFKITNTSQQYEWAPCTIYANKDKDKDNDSRWHFIGTIVQALALLKPAETTSVAFDALILVPGVYTFSANHLGIVGYEYLHQYNQRIPSRVLVNID